MNVNANIRTRSNHLDAVATAAFTAHLYILGAAVGVLAVFASLRPLVA